MNRISIRTTYHGAVPACYGKTGWAHWPANDANAAREFQADDGTQTVCNAQDVTLWWPVVAANAA